MNRPRDLCADALDRFAVVLEEERAALRDMDAPKVVLAAKEKERCVAELIEAGIGGSPEHAARVAEIVQMQQQNLRLLVHARDCVHDALVATGAVAPGYGRGKPTIAPGATIDVRG